MDVDGIHVEVDRSIVMRSMRYAVVVALAVAAANPGAAVAAGSPARSDQRVVARVDGHTYVLLGPTVFGVTVQQDPLAYTAFRTSSGTVGGRWIYDYYEGGVETTFKGRVTCLAVEGNRAWIGGTVTGSSDPTQIGLGAWWQIADNGSGRHPVVPDRTTFAGFGTLAQTQAYCDMAPDPHFIFDVQLGGVRVSAG